MPGSVGQYTIGWYPWEGVTSATGITGHGTNVSSRLGMGFLDSGTGAQNDQVSWDFWMDAGVWTFAMIHNTNTDIGIYTVNFNGSSVGTVDGYGSNVADVYSAITGISVAAGVVTVQQKMATKNASATSYRYLVQSNALIRTSGTASTPGGTDTPGYTWMHIPWMGIKTTSTTITNTQTSAAFSGGYANQNSGVQNDYWETDLWLDGGTFKVCGIYLQNTDRGIASLRINGTEKATMDMYGTYDGGTGTYKEVTGVTIAAPTAAQTFRSQMATKNASSSGYVQGWHSVAWIRTGA